MRDALLEGVDALRIPEPPIDQIINHFGHKTVAEITGRHSRRIRLEDGDDLKFHQRNPAVANKAEADAFADNKKQILIFSGAGDTGFSYHASPIKSRGSICDRP